MCGERGGNMKVKNEQTKDESVNERMIDEVFTAEFRKKFEDAVMPSIESFEKAHPYVAISFNFTVEINDGLLAYKGSLKSDAKELVKLLRQRAHLKMQAALTIQAA
jgi:hypothetical protein